MTKALILAAGQGSRLRPLTNTRPKCLVELNGKSLLSHQFKTLNSVMIGDIHVVTGYLAQKIEALGIETSYNEKYDKTNMVYSLFCAMEFLKSCEEDLVIAYGDIIYEKKNLDALMESEHDISCMIDKNWLKLWSLRNENPLDDAETLVVDSVDNIIEIGKKPINYENIKGQYTGLIKIKAEAIPKIIAFYKSLNNQANYDGQDFDNMYMTSFLQQMIDCGFNIHAVFVSNGWLEVDTVLDLQLYEQLQLNGELAEICSI